MKKALSVVAVFMLFAVIICPFAVSAGETYLEDAEIQRNIDSQLEILDLDSIGDVIKSSKTVPVKSADLKDLIFRAIRGEIDVSPDSIFRYILSGLFSEIGSFASLMKNMVLISIIGALFKNLSSSFKQDGISEVGFFVTYIVITILLVSSLNICVGIAHGLISEVCSLMEASIPVMMSLLYMSGKVTTAYVINPMLLFINSFTVKFVRDVILTVITVAAGLELVNHISDRALLTKLSELVTKTVGWVMKGIAVLFIGILSLQGLSAPILSNGVTKSAKAVINVVPFVGQALTGAVDTVSIWAGAVKTGTMVALIIVMVMICAAPILKLLALMLIFKLTAGLIQPISEPRIVKAIDATGSYAVLLLGACVLVTVLFMFAAMITLSL